MADLGLGFGDPTDPRMAMARALMQQGAEDTPLRSGWQAAARALQGLVGGYEAGQLRKQQLGAYAELAGIPGQPDASGQGGQPGFLGRLFGASSQPAAGAPSPSAASPQTPAPSGSPQPGPATASPAPADPATASAPPVSPNAVASQLGYAQRMVAAGQKTGNVGLMQQGLQLMAAIREKMAESEITVHTDLAKQGMRYDPLTGRVSPIEDYNKNIGATAEAKSHGTKSGELAPDVTTGMVTQQNAVNAGTSASAAAKAGAATHATQMAENAPDVADAAAAKAGRVAHSTALATNAPDVVAAEAARAQQIAQAQEQAKTDFAGKIADITTRATNAANAGKPLTPDQKVSLQQTASHEFTELPQVKEHYETAKSFKNVLAAAASTDKASDINLIDSVAKLFNPGGVIRQGSFNIIQNEVQGLPSNIMGEIKGAYSNQAHLSVAARQALVQQAKARMSSSRDTYNQFADFAAQTATANGLDPRAVVPTFIDPLTAQEIARQRGLIK